LSAVAGDQGRWQLGGTLDGEEPVMQLIRKAALAPGEWRHSYPHSLASKAAISARQAPRTEFPGR
jgi:hypothetical protein